MYASFSWQVAPKRGTQDNRPHEPRDGKGHRVTRNRSITGKMSIEPRFDRAESFSERPARRLCGGPNPIFKIEQKDLCQPIYLEKNAIIG